MKNQKYLLSLPIDPCPAVPPVAVKEDLRYFKESDGSFIYSMTIIDNAGTKTLATEIYRIDGIPVMRIFLDDYKWITQFFSNDPKKQDTYSEAEFNNILWKCGYDDRYPKVRGYYVANENTAAAAQQFFKSFEDKYKPLWRLYCYQQDIRKQAVTRRNDRIRKSVDDVMLAIRPLPKDFEEWVDKEALRKSRYIFYDYRHGHALMDGYCTVCHTDVKVRRPHHNAEGKCPNCGARIVFKAQRIATEVRDTTDVAYIQPLSGGWVIRYFSVVKDYSAHYSYSYRDPDLYIHEDKREFDTADIQKVFEWDNFRQTGEYRFCEQYYGKHCGGRYILYTRNLHRLFKNESGNRKYFPFADVVKHSEPMNTANLLIEVIRKPQLEFLAKLKLYNIVVDIVNGYRTESINLQGKGLFAVLGVDKHDLLTLQKLDPDIDDLEIYKIARRCGVKCAVEAVEWVRRHNENLSYGNRSSLGNIIKHVSPHKAIRYLDKQGERLINNADEKSKYSWERFRYHSMGDVIQTWNDYLDFCVKLQYDMKNDFVLFPLNISQAHDDTYSLVEAKHEEIHNRELAKISGIAAEYNQIYSWHTKSLLIRAPRDAAEIIAEGQKLHHCVGSYVDKVATRKTVILFIRKTDDPETPYCTLEFKNGSVTQCYGHHDTQPPAEVKQFVAAWQRIWKPAVLEKNTAITIKEAV